MNIRTLGLPFDRTLEEIADELGLSRERVRQLEASALRKLRRALEREGLGFEDLRKERDDG